MPQGHDSTVDAQAAMMAAKYAVRHETGRIILSALSCMDLVLTSDVMRVFLPQEDANHKGVHRPCNARYATFQLGQLIGKSSDHTSAKALSNEASCVDMAVITKNAIVQRGSNAQISEAMLHGPVGCGCTDFRRTYRARIWKVFFSRIPVSSRQQ